MTLARHQFSVQDAAGNVVPGAHVEVRREISGQPLAAVYSDRDGAIPLGNPFDADATGFAFFYVSGGSYQIRVYTGPSGAPTFEAPLWRYVGIGLNSESDAAGVPTQRTVTEAGDVTVSADDVDVIFIDKAIAAATTVNLPSAAARTRKIQIIDGKADANTNNIKIYPVSGQKTFGIVNNPVVIDGNGGNVVLTPRADGTGWY
ncbi:hypothetical protein [Tardiphaga sp. 862_B3_N1_1]|uniref:hypothetical protein n=1 Tax=Tardiphaga sp. 862_B3_N1_1 TaxID=3240763 RepID=UPI003F8A6C3F